MRPRKIILLVDPDEITQSVHRLRLQVWGFAVLSCPTKARALRILAEAPAGGNNRIAVTLANLSPDGSAKLSKRHPKHVPVICLDRYSLDVPPSLLRERLKSLGAGKRGPTGPTTKRHDVWRESVMLSTKRPLQRVA
jgi:hypothetical protein